MIHFNKMTEYDYEQLIFCQDRTSGLKAIICIHDTALGPALGGCRMYPYEREEDAVVDVLRLARGMTYKAAVAGLNLGGGKAVIIGDPKKDKSEALFRAFGRFIQTLKGRYITAEDVGTSLQDMTFINMETNHVTGIMKSRGGSGDPSPVTARGVYNGIKACWNHLEGHANLKGLTIAVQGLGHVGQNLCQLLHEDGVRLIVADLNERAVAEAVERFAAEPIAAEKIHAVKCDIFSPCALGAALNSESIPELQCRVVAGAANNQLDNEIEDGERLDKLGIIYAPDFVINAGGLMNVYEELAGYSQERALKRVDYLFYTITSILEISKKKNIPTYLAADVVAEQRLEQIRHVNSIWTHAEVAVGR
jgi:leucine dehydrogenase